jgi:hypothetical protein
LSLDFRLIYLRAISLTPRTYVMYRLGYFVFKIAPDRCDGSWRKVVRTDKISHQRFFQDRIDVLRSHDRRPSCFYRLGSDAVEYMLARCLVRKRSSYIVHFVREAPIEQSQRPKGWHVLLSIPV